MSDQRFIVLTEWCRTMQVVCAWLHDFKARCHNEYDIVPTDRKILRLVNILMS